MTQNPQWQYATAADIGQSVAERLRNFPREPDLLVYTLRSAAAVALRTWLRGYHRLAITGRENLPPAGSFIMVANHSSHLDALCMLSALPLRKLHRAFAAAAQDYFFVTLSRAAVSSIFINAVPFSRSTRVRRSLAVCQALLENPGNVLILFPEGTRSEDGVLAPFRPGIGRLAACAGVPVVPCALHGAFAAWPKHARLPRPRAVRLCIGKPLVFEKSVDGGSVRAAEKAIAQGLHGAVEDLLCQ